MVAERWGKEKMLGHPEEGEAILANRGKVTGYLVEGVSREKRASWAKVLGQPEVVILESLEEVETMGCLEKVVEESQEGEDLF